MDVDERFFKRHQTGDTQASFILKNTTMHFNVKNMDFGCVLTEEIGGRTTTRAIESSEKFVEYLAGIIEQKLKENKLDEFVVNFNIDYPPPRQG